MTARPPVDVPEAFDQVAGTYDLMVSLSPGYHSQLRRSASALVAGALQQAATCSEGTDARRKPDLRRGPDAREGNGAGGAAGALQRCAGTEGAVTGQGEPAPLRLVDLGCGSGASTRALLQAVREAGGDVPVQVIGVDGSAGMLQAARRKHWPPSVEFVQARAEELAGVSALGLPGSLDGVFAAYLLRNVADRDGLLSQVHALLRPGAPLVLHEYSVAGNRRAEVVWTAVCHGVIVPLAWLVSRRTGIYRYLWRSVMSFDSVPDLMVRMQRAGFTDVRARSFPGWQHGIIHTIHGRRPS